MVTELQFVAVAAFLIWGLAASLCGVLTAAPDTARLVRLHRDVEPEVPLPEHASPSIDPSLDVHENVGVRRTRHLS